MNVKWITIGLIIGTAFFCLNRNGVLGRPIESGDFYGLINEKDSVEQSACLNDHSSTKPYPESGTLELTPKEKSTLIAVKPVEILGAEGAALLTNQDADPAKVIFTNEQGQVVSKVFIRAKSNTQLNLNPGSYDVWVESGLDWNGNSFIGCIKEIKAKGVMVIEPDKYSNVVLLGESAFILANRIDAKIAHLLFEEVKNKIEDEMSIRPERGREMRP